MARRSVLFSPGDRPELMRKAPGTGADVVVYDLEDAVAPGKKEEGREAVHGVLTDPSFDPDCEVCVRVSTDAASADLAAVLDDEARLDAVMLPKAESAEDVATLAAMLEERDASLPVFALCETAAGVLHAEAIASADATTAVAFGAEDLSADIGANRTEEGTEVLYAREHVVLAASAAGVDAIDTVFTDIDDTDRLAEETTFARDLGYDGKIAIHPAQVPVINEAFTPSEEQVAWARRVLDARDDHDGEGVFRVDGEMVDAPLISRAENVLDRAGVR
ncbi:HpcH/HpaI aldolase/citrate lyase family protein [Halomarina salina]|uniref:HpcH/HpaI aldolase/citrate lyase family protein n=1 Tax=Halomarina salina TaxID=1872699 RepID=A0ABD5RIR5_9EURY|nr:CoA ester lyase [Halomarina salina]